MPEIRYSAALIGPGSEVLGYETAVSRDHDWGPRVTLLVPSAELEATSSSLSMAMDHEVPETFLRYPVRFALSDPGAGTAPRPGRIAGTHRVEITSVVDWCQDHFGLSFTVDMCVADWLRIPQQRLLGFTAGRVFRDDLDELTDARERLAWYPDDVWRYLLACQWQRVAQLEPIVGRTGDVGDDLGSRLIAASLSRDAMRLAFLIERRYAPYAKWIGSAFQRLPIATSISDGLNAALAAAGWRERESALVAVFEALGHATNALGLADLVEPTRRAFYDRPYTVLDAHRYREALNQRINDPEVRAVIDRWGWVGAIDQFSDSVDLLTSPDRCERVGPGDR